LFSEKYIDTITHSRHVTFYPLRATLAALFVESGKPDFANWSGANERSPKRHPFEANNTPWITLVSDETVHWWSLFIYIYLKVCENWTIWEVTILMEIPVTLKNLRGNVQITNLNTIWFSSGKTRLPTRTAMAQRGIAFHSPLLHNWCTRIAYISSVGLTQILLLISTWAWIYFINCF
jgi:hypothetical protein